MEDSTNILDDHEVAANFLDTLPPLIKRGMDGFLKAQAEKNPDFVAMVFKAIAQGHAQLKIVVTTNPVEVSGVFCAMEQGAFPPKTLWRIPIGKAEFNFGIPQA